MSIQIIDDDIRFADGETLKFKLSKAGGGSLGTFKVYTATGTTDLVIPASTDLPTTMTASTAIAFQVATANTTVSTLNVNGLGAETLNLTGGSKAGVVYIAIYNGTSYDIGEVKGTGGGTSAGTPTPLLTGVTTGLKDTDINVTIANYDSSATYTFTPTNGVATRVNGVITWTLPTVTVDGSEILSVTASKNSVDSLTANHTVNVTTGNTGGTTYNVPTLSNLPDSVNENSTTTVIIDNFLSSVIYEITATSGTIVYTTGTTFEYIAPDVTDAGVSAPYTDTVSIVAKSGLIVTPKSSKTVTYIYVAMTVDDLISNASYSTNKKTSTGWEY